MNTFFNLLMMPQAGAAGAGGEAAGGQLFTTFITFGLVILIFYFLIIRPQNKKQKDAKKMIEAVKKGDKIETIGGIRGSVLSVKEDTIILSVDDSVKMEFKKSAISTVLEQKESPKKGKDTKEKLESPDKKDSKNNKETKA